MKNELISFETAKLAKERGFKWESRNGYLPDGSIGISNYSTYCENDLEDYPTKYSAPTQSLLQRWLREVHGVHIVVDYYGKSEYLIEVLNYKGNNMIGESLKGVYFETYEEALEVGLGEALKSIKL